jgi:hypothetical protein
MKVRTISGGRALVAAGTTDNATSLGDTDAVHLMSANEHRSSLTVSNFGTVSLYVKLGASASSTSYHYILAGGGANFDGNGGAVSIEGYTGIVTVSAAYTDTVGKVGHCEFG